MTNNGNALAAKLAACQALDARGCKMTLCHPRGKEPYMVGWTSGLALEEMADRLSRCPNDNIGVVTGKVSDDQFCIDLDNPIAVELADQFLPPTPLVVGRGANPRTHWFYRVPSGIKATKFKLPADPNDKEKKLTVVEVLGDGNQVIVGPSVHPSGDVYGLLDGDPATVDGAELLEAAESLFHAVLDRLGLIPDEKSKTNGNGRSQNAGGSSGLSPGKDFDDRGDVRELLQRHGWTRIGNSGNDERWRRPGKDHGISATLKDGRLFYCFTSSAAGLDGGKGYGPFGLFTALECSGDFHQAHEKLKPLGFGELLEQNNGGGTHQPTGASEGGQHSTSSPRTPPPMRSVRDLIGGFHNMRKPIIYGLLREGETMNLIAASKVGKSWLATNLALTFSTRRQWLGRFDTAGGDVLIVDNELHPETSAYRIPAVANANEIPLDEYADHVFVMNLRGELVSLPQLATFLDTIEPGRFKLVILDAFYRFLPPGVDENDNGAMAGLYNLLDRVAAKLQCAFVCIHHASKGSQSAKAVTDVGSGAGSMSRAADCHVVLRPHEESNVVVMEAATRSWPPLEPLCLRWTFPVFAPDDSLDPALLRPDRPRRPAKSSAEPADKAPTEPPWTHQRFAAAFGSDAPQTRDAIMAKAVDGGLAARKADVLFKLAEGAGLLFEWPNVVRRKRGFATVRPSADTQKITHTHPPGPPQHKAAKKRRVGVGGSERVGKRKAEPLKNELAERN